MKCSGSGCVTGNQWRDVGSNANYAKRVLEDIMSSIDEAMPSRAIFDVLRKQWMSRKLRQTRTGIRVERKQRYTPVSRRTIRIAPSFRLDHVISRGINTKIPVFRGNNNLPMKVALGFEHRMFRNMSNFLSIVSRALACDRSA